MDAKRKNQSVRLEKTVEKQLAEREKINRMMLDLYPDFKSGLISRQEYINLKAEFQNKLEMLDESVEKLKKTAEEYENGMEDNSFVESFRRIGNIEKLTRSVLTELIEVILVHEGGNITIRMKCRDAFEQAAEYIEMNKDIGKTA